MKIILGLLLIVALHEFGHLTLARLLKVEVKRCYIFFNPYFTLLKFKLRKTEYGLGWLPFGGYTEFDERATTSAKRLIIYSGGVLVNFIFGFAILGSSAFTIIAEYVYCIAHGEIIALTQYSFLHLTAFFSILLGLVNLLPIGSLDGRKIYASGKQTYNLIYIFRKYAKEKKKRAGR